MGWRPFPLPAMQKSPPPPGFTGGDPAAVKLAGDRDAWTARIRPYLERDEYASNNTGVRMPPNVLAIDIDDYEKDGVTKSGWASLIAFAEAYGLDHPEESLPATVRTSSRGYQNISGHRFYRLPEGVDAEEAMARIPGEAAPGVEILRPTHRYTIEAGSLHPNGGLYRTWDERRAKGKRELKNGLGSISPEDIPELPMAWMEALIASRPEAAHSTHDLGSEARELSERMMNEWLDEHDLDVDDLTRDQVMSLLTPTARKAVLSFGNPKWHNNNVTTPCIHLLATFAEDIGEEGDLPMRDAIEIARDLYVRNGSQKDRPGEFDRALAWAFPKAMRAVATDEKATTLELAEAAISNDFWTQTEVLRSCRDFARSRLVAPDAMLACAVVLVSSWLPPHIVLPGLVGDAAGLNFYVALAAASGGGKSAAMKAARAWLNVKPHPDSELATDEPYVTTVSTAQGLVQAYTMSQPKPKNEARRPGEVEHIQVRRSVRFEVDEIGALGAAMNAEGSMLKDFIKTMWTGSGIGTTAAEATRVRKLDDHEFRMTILAGVQPSTADVILSGHGDGFPQRWLWVEAFDEAPLTQEEWRAARANPPAPLNWTPPAAARPLNLGTQSDDGKKLIRAFSKPAHTGPKLQELEITESFEMKVYQAQASASRRIGDVDVSMDDVLDGHSVLLQEKLAALIAALHGKLGITDQFERIAEYMTAKSDATRAAILHERHAQSLKEMEARAKRDGMSSAIAEEVRTMTELERSTERLITELSAAGGSLSLTEARRHFQVSISGGKSELIAMFDSLPGVKCDGKTVSLDLES